MATLLPPRIGVKKRVGLQTSDSSPGIAPDPGRALAPPRARLLGKLPARANLAQRRVDDAQRSSRAIRAGPTIAPTTTFAALSPLIGIEAPHAEEEAGEYRASNHGQKEDRQRFLN